MQEEATQKTIALVFRATSFSARHFEAVLREAKHDMEKHETKMQNLKFHKQQLKAAAHPKKKPPEKHRKVRVAELAGRGDNLKTIEIPEDVRSFERLARKYNIEFSVKKDKSVDPPKYIVFFKARDTDLLKECFKDYMDRQDKKREMPSFRERLQELKRKVEQRERTLKRILTREDQSL